MKTHSTYPYNMVSSVRKIFFAVIALILISFLGVIAYEYTDSPITKSEAIAYLEAHPYNPNETPVLYHFNYTQQPASDGWSWMVLSYPCANSPADSLSLIRKRRQGQNYEITADPSEHDWYYESYIANQPPHSDHLERVLRCDFVKNLEVKTNLRKSRPRGYSNSIPNNTINENAGTLISPNPQSIEALANVISENKATIRPTLSQNKRNYTYAFYTLNTINDDIGICRNITVYKHTIEVEEESGSTKITRQELDYFCQLLRD